MAINISDPIKQENSTNFYDCEHAKFLNSE